MSNQLAKHKLHIFNDILFICNFIAKMPPFYPTNVSFERNSSNLNKVHYTEYNVPEKLTFRNIFLSFMY